jgi:hypothetical protein
MKPGRGHANAAAGFQWLQMWSYRPAAGAGQQSAMAAAAIEPEAWCQSSAQGMIRQGVSEERIAKTLAVDIAAIRRKRDLLDGICPEAVQLLKEKRACAGAFREMRKVKPMRQIEMAELMVAANNFSASYARCLLAATPQEQLLEPDKPKDVGGLTPEDMSRMEREMANLGQDLRAVEESHGRNVLNLVLVVGYLKKLLDNARVVRYLSQHSAEILAEFQAIVEAQSLGTGE